MKGIENNRRTRRPSLKIEMDRPVVIESMELAFENPGRVRFSGVLTTDTAQDETERVLWKIHSHILTANMAAFTVDVRLLNFVSSSGLRVFINWVSRAERARYKLVFVMDPTVAWHRSNLSVLKSLAPRSVEVRSGRTVGSSSHTKKSATPLTSVGRSPRRDSVQIRSQGNPIRRVAKPS